MKISRPLVVFDLETTGTWVEKDKIVEIGMIKLLVDGTTESYVKRVNPGIPIPAYISSLINISDSDIKDSPRFRDIAEEVLNFIEKADLGGFNIERFDLPILQREIALSGLKFDWSDRVIYDAQKIFHVNERRDLVAACRILSIFSLIETTDIPRLRSRDLYIIESSLFLANLDNFHTRIVLKGLSFFLDAVIIC